MNNKYKIVLVSAVFVVVVLLIGAAMFRSSNDDGATTEYRVTQIEAKLKVWNTLSGDAQKNVVLAQIKADASRLEPNQVPADVKSFLNGHKSDATAPPAQRDAIAPTAHGNVPD